MSYEAIRALVNSDRENLSPADLLELQRRIAGERFHLATVVAQKRRAFAQAELDRKALILLKKSEAKIDHAKTTGKPMTETAATDAAEQHPEVGRARLAEINAEMEFDEARLILSTSEGVLSSLVMRISDLKSERFHSAKVTHS